MEEIKRSNDDTINYYVKFLEDNGVSANPNIRVANKDRKHSNVRGEFASIDHMPAIYNNGISLRLSQELINDQEESNCPYCDKPLVDGHTVVDCPNCSNFTPEDQPNPDDIMGQSNNGPLLKMDLTKFSKPLASAQGKFKKLAQFGEEGRYKDNGSMIEAPRPHGLEDRIDSDNWDDDGFENDSPKLSCPKCGVPWTQYGVDYLVTDDTDNGSYDGYNSPRGSYPSDNGHLIACQHCDFHKDIPEEMFIEFKYNRKQEADRQKLLQTSASTSTKFKRIA